MDMAKKVSLVLFVLLFEGIEVCGTGPLFDFVAVIYEYCAAFD